MIIRSVQRDGHDPLSNVMAHSYISGYVSQQPADCHCYSLSIAIFSYTVMKVTSV